MKKINLISACLLLLATTLGATDSFAVGKVNFFEGSVISAKEKAMAEQKQYFLEFYADWCKPCKWMEENTYSDSELAEYIHGNYVPVKVNIDDFDGHALKQKYNVQYLPTIIVFDAQGNMLGKYEKSLNASKLLKKLKSHRVAHATVNQTTEYATTTNDTYTNTAYTTNAQNDYVPTPSKSTYPTNRVVTTGSNGERLFSIQVGVYKNANNVFNQVERLKYKFTEPVQVINHKDPSKGVLMYRIVVGKFYSKKAAEEYLKTVKRSGVDGFVKDITDYEVTEK